VAAAFYLLDQQVGGFGGPVGDAAGVEVGQQFVPSGVDGASQAVQLGHVGVGAVGEPAVQPLLGPSAITGLVDQPQVLGGDPGGADLGVAVAGLQAGQQPGPGVR
jgi:hypothetical protein